MSQSDWQFTLLNPSYSFIGGTSGSAVLNSSLSNPLTSSGDWCRTFIASPGGYYLSAVSMLPINNSELTSSSGYEYGYGYSIRIWSRINNLSDNTTKIVFKGNNTLSIGVSSADDGTTTGYALVHKNNNLRLYCRVDDNPYVSNSENSPDDPSTYTNGFYKNNILSLAHSTWHHLRMDVSPISGAYDKITIFTGSFGTWQQVYTVSIPKLKIAAYVPWANNPNGDGANAAGKGYMGIVVKNTLATEPVWIDGFEVYKERIIP